MKILSWPANRWPGWVSENFLALIRISKWFFGILPEISDDQKWSPPPKPQPLWNMKDNKAWLKIRGLPIKGKALTIKKRVAEYMAMKEVPEPLPPRGGSIQLTLGTINSLYDFVCTVMKKYNRKGCENGGGTCKNLSVKVC